MGKSEFSHLEFVVPNKMTQHAIVDNSSVFKGIYEVPVYHSKIDVSGQFSEVSTASSGVAFIEPVDIYLQSERSIKYAVLFIGLSFITFFILEHMSRQPIHPIQYTFVGLAIAVFYLLLISLAEHLPFHWAYLTGVSCCSSLILFYVRYMLRSGLAAAGFGAMIVGLYALLYVIVQAEDFALLMGSVLVFGVLVALMYVTRDIDWYSIRDTEKSLASGV